MKLNPPRRAALLRHTALAAAALCLSEIGRAHV